MTAHKRILLYFLLVVGALSVIHSLTTPPFEPPDELYHYQFVRHLLDQRTLPVQLPGSEISQSHQPPLYYLVGSLLVSAIPDPAHVPERNPFWTSEEGELIQDNKRQFLPDSAYAFPYAGTARVLHGLRLLSVAFALGSVVAIWLLGVRLWPTHPPKVAAMLALAALNPMFLYIAGAINNDNAIIFWGAWLVWLAVYALDKQFTWTLTVLIGLFWAAALLTKLSGLVLAAPWLAALVWQSWQRRDARLFLSRLGVILGIAALLAGWWFVRNVSLYGEPFALNRMLSVWGVRGAAELTASRMILDIRYAWTNFWGRFAYGQVLLPSFYYFLFLLLTLLAVLGGGWWLAARRYRRLSLSRRAVWFVLACTLGAFMAAFFYFLWRNPTGGNGRYIFPALPAFAAIMIGALSVWLERLKRPAWGYGTVVGMMGGLAVYSLFFLWQTYAPPPRYSLARPPDIAHRVEAVYPGLATLIGYTLEPETAVPGKPLLVTLYWQVTGDTDDNYPLFVQLVTADGRRIAGRDTHAGLGRYPTSQWSTSQWSTSQWQPGEIIADTIPVPIPDGLEGPTGVYLNVGLWGADGRLLPTTANQTTQTLGMIRLGPQTPLPAANPALYNLGDVVELVQINPPQTTARPGDRLAFSLTWRAAQNPAQDYSVFIHLVDAQGNLIQTYDHPPRRGAFPTRLWQPGDVVVDARELALPADIKPGLYTAVGGWYLSPDGPRLPVTAANGQAAPDGVIPLFTLEIGG